MKRITIRLNGLDLHVYVDGDCDAVELGREGLVPMQRDHRLSVSDEVDAKRKGKDGAREDLGKVEVVYELAVVGVEDM